MKKTVKAWVTLDRKTKEFCDVEFEEIDGLNRYQQVPCTITYDLPKKRGKK